MFRRYVPGKYHHNAETQSKFQQLRFSLKNQNHCHPDWLLSFSMTKWIVTYGHQYNSETNFKFIQIFQELQNK